MYWIGFILGCTLIAFLSIFITESRSSMLIVAMVLGGVWGAVWRPIYDKFFNKGSNREDQDASV